MTLAVDAGQRLGVPILLDVPAATTHRWVADMERAGVDGFTITTDIDLGIGNTAALDAARELRAWTHLPVAVSGGFSGTGHASFASPDWDILIVGRSVRRRHRPGHRSRPHRRTRRRTERQS